MAKLDFKKSQWLDVENFRRDNNTPDLSDARSPIELVTKITSLPGVSHDVIKDLRDRTVAALSEPESNSAPSEFGIANAVQQIRRTSPDKIFAHGKTQPMASLIEQQIATAQTFNELRGFLNIKLSVQENSFPTEYLATHSEHPKNIQNARIIEELENAYADRDPSLAPNIFGIREALTKILAKEAEINRDQKFLSPPVTRRKTAPITRNPALAETRKIDPPNLAMSSEKFTPVKPENP